MRKTRSGIGELIEYFVCGGVGGVALVLVGHPFDTIKVRMQTSSTSASDTKCTTALGCTKSTFQNEGIRGFYKGMSIPLGIIVPIMAMIFMSYRVGKDIFIPPDGPYKFSNYYKAGSFSGVIQTVLIAPGERIKCLLQIQYSDVNKKYKGPIDCVVKLMKEGGLRHLYKGTLATLVRELMARGMYFGVYEHCKRKFKEHGILSNDFVLAFFSGGIGGVAFWVVAMPADVVKSRMQTAPPDQYKNTRDVVQTLIRQDGYRGFFKGTIPIMMRAFPANAAVLVGFEATKHIMDRFDF